MEPKAMPSIPTANSKMGQSLEALLMVFHPLIYPFTTAYLLPYQMHKITKIKEKTCTESNYMIKQG